MTAEQWEAWTEQTKIMEKEDGLDRKTAIIAAFACCCPDDYRAMRENAAGMNGGDAALYEFLVVMRGRKPPQRTHRPLFHSPPST